MRHPTPRGTVHATLTAHGSGRCVLIHRFHVLVFRPNSSVRAPGRTSNLYHSLHTFHGLRGHPSCFRKHPFGLGIALSSRLWIPGAFRLLAFAAEAIPSPLRICAAVAVGLRASARPYGGYHVPHPQATTDVGVLYIAVGLWCSRTGSGRTGSLPARCLLAGTPHMVHRSGMVSHAFTFRWLGLTRPQRGFTYVRPIGLSLACSSGESEPLDIAAPASYPAVTSDALGLGTGLNTGRKRYDPLTLWMRLRVAQAKSPRMKLRQWDLPTQYGYEVAYDTSMV